MRRTNVFLDQMDTAIKKVKARTAERVQHELPSAAASTAVAQQEQAALAAAGTAVVTAPSAGAAVQQPGTIHSGASLWYIVQPERSASVGTQRMSQRLIDQARLSTLIWCMSRW